MPEKQSYTAQKAFAMPTGEPVRAGETVQLSPRQAKYLLLAGKIGPAARTTAAVKPAPAPTATPDKPAPERKPAAKTTSKEK